MAGDLNGEKEKLSDVFEMTDQASSCVMRSGVYNCDLRREELFHESFSDIGIQFWSKRATWDTMLQMNDYNAIGDHVSTLDGWM